MASDSSALLLLSMQTVLPVLNSPKLLEGEDAPHVSCDRAQLRLSLTLSCSGRPSLCSPAYSFSSPILSPIFGPLRSLDTHTLRVCISPRGMWQLYTAVYEGPVWGSQGSKPRLPAKAVHAISRTPSPSCKMDQVSHVTSNLVSLFRGVDPHAVDTSPCRNTPVRPILWCPLGPVCVSIFFSLCTSNQATNCLLDEIHF